MMLLCLGATTIGVLLVLVMNTVAPLIMAEMRIGPTVMGFAMAAVTISAMFSSPIIGSLIDRIGPVKIMSVGLAFMARATALTGTVCSAACTSITCATLCTVT